jgi:hypothetical protein
VEHFNHAMPMLPEYYFGNVILWICLLGYNCPYQGWSFSVMWLDDGNQPADMTAWRIQLCELFIFTLPPITDRDELVVVTRAS